VPQQPVQDDEPKVVYKSEKYGEQPEGILNDAVIWESHDDEKLTRQCRVQSIKFLKLSDKIGIDNSRKHVDNLVEKYQDSRISKGTYLAELREEREYLSNQTTNRRKLHDLISDDKVCEYIQLSILKWIRQTVRVNGLIEAQTQELYCHPFSHHEWPVMTELEQQQVYERFVEFPKVGSPEWEEMEVEGGSWASLPPIEDNIDPKTGCVIESLTLGPCKVWTPQ
jgi:hypothetical protein